MNPDAIIDAFAARPDPGLVSPFLLRLARGQSRLHEPLDAVVEDPVLRMLCGLDDPGSQAPSGELGAMILWAQACLDSGSPPPENILADLESRARGDLQWWVPAARLHARCSNARERQARMALSEQSLPYVFPGSLDPLQIELLAAGDFVLAALHVDWVRKLSIFVLEALSLDLRNTGGWFWPLLEVLDGRRAGRDVLKAAKRPRRGPGGLGMLGAYLVRLGEPWENLSAQFGPADELLVSVAIVGERPT